MTAMDIKVLIPRLIFFGILIGVIITLFNMCAPDPGDGGCKTSSQTLFDKEILLDSINKIAWVETYIPERNVVVYLTDEKSGIANITIKDMREEIDKISNCFIYSKGRKGEKSFIFSVKHVTNCVTKREDNYDREIKLKGGWRQRINKDAASKLRRIIDENVECSPNECGVRCCKPTKKTLNQ